MNPIQPALCNDFTSQTVGSPLCYAEAVAEAYFDGEWRPVCAKHARDHVARRLLPQPYERAGQP